MAVDIDTLHIQTKAAQRITITGVVQGVGFRPFVYNLATEMGLTGWVLNHSGGVDIEVEGPAPDVQAFVADLRTKAPPLASIESLTAQPITAQNYAGFEIRHSERQEGRYQLISPDVATCSDCLRELFDPEDRRYRYPFINCTNCGPRFTIIQDIPYDRPNTTMRVFPMCDDCQAEYEDPRDRRFHAQPNACPTCGPRVWLVESPKERESDTPSQQAKEPTGKQLATSEPANPHSPASIYGKAPDNLSNTSDAVFVRAKELLLSGKILAIKGLGGFHLACDATNAEAVAMLRARKHRPHKPFAIMVPTLKDVKAICVVSPEAEALLTSPQCPIVLLDTHDATQAGMGVRVAENVAPNNHTLGVMIPYTPLHHILLRDVGRPLVMTSGNMTEEPIAKDNDEALRRLAHLADAFLLHNRDIHARYDDSVMQVVAMEVSEDGSAASEEANRRESVDANAPAITVPQTEESTDASGAQPASDGALRPASSFTVPSRRARGYAPFPIRLPFTARQIFAAGPLLKNTFTLTRDRYAFVSQHIGDLENLDTLDHYEAALATYQHLFRIEPEAVVCDSHPDYMSTRFAEAFAREHGLASPYQIQHHEAHIAACLADNGWAEDQGPVIGVALDGTGFGTDGNIWGGEWFIGDYHGFERVAHLEYLPLPGGDAATKHPWRIAVAYLHALGLDASLPLGEFCPGDVMRVRTLVDRRLNTPLTSSMGRLFDAVSALLGLCTTATYEAQAAIELEQAVRADDRQRTRMMPTAYPFILNTNRRPYEIQVAALLDAILEDLSRHVAAARISRRFHVTVVAMIVEVCRKLQADHGIHTVALSGGVFQNRLLMSMVVPQLTEAGFEVLHHHQVPPNDGGISLGQVALAQFALARDASEEVACAESSSARSSHRP